MGEKEETENSNSQTLCLSFNSKSMQRSPKIAAVLKWDTLWGPSRAYVPGCGIATSPANRWQLIWGCQPAQQPTCPVCLTHRLPAGPLIQPGRSNHLARKELQYHLYQHQQLLHGYTDFVARHTHQLLSLVLRKPPAPGSSLHHVLVTAAEFEQLGLLLRSSGTEEPSASQQGGSPMDIGPASPFLGGHLVQGVLG